MDVDVPGVIVVSTGELGATDEGVAALNELRGVLCSLTKLELAVDDEELEGAEAHAVMLSAVTPTQQADHRTRTVSHLENRPALTPRHLSVRRAIESSHRCTASSGDGITGTAVVGFVRGASRR